MNHVGFVFLVLTQTYLLMRDTSMFVSSYSPCYPLPSITPTSKIHFGYETPSILDELTVNEKPNEEELKRAIDLMYEIESTEFKERNLALNPRLS